MSNRKKTRISVIFWFKGRDIENLKKQVEIISIPLVVLAATLLLRRRNGRSPFPREEAGIVILAMIFGIAVVVARDIQRWRDQTEFLEDIMQVLEDKEEKLIHMIRVIRLKRKQLREDSYWLTGIFRLLCRQMWQERHTDSIGNKCDRGIGRVHNAWRIWILFCTGEGSTC